MFDCCMINNELDLLEIRFNTLDSVVEKFVVVEAQKTHSGVDKELYLSKPDGSLDYKKLKRFEKFIPKLVVLLASSGDVNGHGWLAWGNENNQRNSILNVLEQHQPSDGLLFISDVDEIPHPQKMLDAKNICLASEGNPVALKMYYSMYYMNYCTEERYWGPYIFKPPFPEKPSHLRWHVCDETGRYDFPCVEDAGWHFSTMGGIDKIRQKIASYAHVEFNCDEIQSTEHLLECMAKGTPYYENIFKFGTYKHLQFTKRDISFLPEYVLDNLDRFSHYLLV
jgi:beta-1,4-mannosyl-glycoprotein beta-1,4-N-acetylglucosaminyltransferase